MKKITVMWIITTNDGMYVKEMRVLHSDHERFTIGTRFDYGFIQIASEEGFIIEILPLISELNKME